METPLPNVSEDLAIYKEMLAHLEDVVFSHDADGRITYLSPSWQQVVHYSPEEIRNLDFQTLLPPEYIAEAQWRTEKQRRGEPVEQPWDLQILDRDGQRIWIQIRTRAVYDEAGNLLQVYGVARNTQEKKALEEKLRQYTGHLENLVDERTRVLRESEEMYRLLVENAHDAIFITREDHIIFANPRTLSMLGYTMEELAGIPFKQMVHPQDRGVLLQHYMDKLKRNSNLGYFTFRAMNKSGDVLWLQINAVRTRWQERSAILNFVRDITQVKKLEQQLIQAQKMEAIGTLAGGIAHDFNNILSAIMGYTEMSLAEAMPGGSLHRRLSRVFQAGERARNLVGQILAFSRQSEPVLKPTAVGPVVTEALALLRASIPSTILFETEIDPDVGEVYADPTQLHQIVMNLCTNAFHAMREKGGTMRVRLTRFEIDESTSGDFLDLRPGRFIRLTVADTGHGMDRTTMEKMFNPYFTTKVKGEGSGLGLSVVHGIVKNLNGAVKVYSEPGKGTTIQIYLPGIDATVREEASNQEFLPGGNEAILAVDDEEIVRELIVEMLSELGYKVESRASSIEALQAFLAGPDRYDLVISDQTMPHLTGIDLAARIHAFRPEFPVIVCTGFSTQLESGDQLPQGVHALVNKPILKRELARAVRRVLDKSKQADG
ncbi:MAG: PAS domain-containing hybrid sensor histidine kinase/response regulator [Thermodesulfobacteriota bacterium]